MNEKSPIAKPTPIPSSPEELAVVVARIDDRTRMMTEHQLPKVERIAEEAKDKAIDVSHRITVLEKHPLHVCEEKDRQRRQDDDISKGHDTNNIQDERIGGLSSFNKWLIGIVVPITLLAGGFVVSTRMTLTANSTTIDATVDDIKRHENLISELPRSSDIKAIVDVAMSKVPENVTNKIEEREKLNLPTVESVENDAKELPLKTYELEQLQLILDRVRKREVNNHSEL